MHYLVNSGFCRSDILKINYSHLIPDSYIGTKKGKKKTSGTSVFLLVLSTSYTDVISVYAGTETESKRTMA